MSSTDNSNNEMLKKSKPMAKWPNKIESLFSLLGYIVGLGNIWRFPYLCMKHGGGAFLIPYFTLLLFCGMPVFFLEMVMGQFSSQGPFGVWNSVPLFQGVGWSYSIVSTVHGVYYNAIMAWILYYLFKSFNTKLPWSECGNWWNTPQCTKQSLGPIYKNISQTISNVTEDGMASYSILYPNPEMVNVSHGIAINTTVNITRLRSPSEEYWEYEVLQLTKGIHDIGEIRLELLGCLALSWILTFLAIVKGIKSLGKALYITVPLPYICLFVLLIRGLTLPGSLDGILFYLTPNWKKLATFQVWTDACTQIFYTLGTAWGAVILMSSFNKFENNCQRQAILLSSLCCLTSFFAGFTVFAIFGFMANDMGVPIDQVVTSGPGLIFVAYPEALSRLPLSPLWSVIFFVMLLAVGLDSQYGTIETVCHSLCTYFPNTIGKRKSVTTAAICIVFFLIGIVFICKGGFYVFQILDWYVAVFSLWLVGICETLLWGYAYGVKRVYKDFELMLGVKPFFWWKICWCFVTPVCLGIVLVWSIMHLTPPTYGSVIYPYWVNSLGWGVSIAPSVPILIVALYKIFTAKGSILQRFKWLLHPSTEWGTSGLSKSPSEDEIEHKCPVAIDNDTSQQNKALLYKEEHV